ncbi:MAG: SH3 domain-containing protein [Anaerolineae bacterium]|nr:SH3 domain-containing protein [Thermoflexales bacterium]MDW8407057.1 SH3 domain-containing protein [Anaerolineae bacterium]
MTDVLVSLSSAWRRFLLCLVAVLAVSLAGCDRDTQRRLATLVPEIKKAQERAEAEQKAQAREDAYRFSGSFAGVSLRADHPLVFKTRGKLMPAIPKAPEAGFGGAAPAHVLFTFGAYQQPYILSARDPQLRVFSVSAYRRIDLAFARIIDELNRVLTERPVEFTSDIPVLPLFNAAQIFRARVRYLSFQNGIGIRFISAYVDELMPITNDNLFYTFQGLTADGRHYVSFFYPLKTAALPDNAGHTLAAQDIDAFIRDFDRYLIDAVNLVEGLPADQFTPDLAALDDLVASLQVAPSLPIDEQSAPGARVGARTGEATDTPAPLPTPEPTLGLWPARATVVLNVRAGPSLNDRILTVLRQGEQVELVGRSVDGNWFRLRTSYGIIGWSYARFLRPYVLIDKLPVLDVGPTSTPPPRPPVPLTPTAAPGE